MRWHPQRDRSDRCWLAPSLLGLLLVLLVHAASVVRAVLVRAAVVSDATGVADTSARTVEDMSEQPTDLLVPDLADVPEDDGAEIEDEDTDHTGPDDFEAQS